MGQRNNCTPSTVMHKGKGNESRWRYGDTSGRPLKELDVNQGPEQESLSLLVEGDFALRNFPLGLAHGSEEWSNSRG